MEMTRNLPDEQKLILKERCEKTLLNHKEAKKLSWNQLERFKKIDPLRIESITNLKFMKSDTKTLEEWYKESRFNDEDQVEQRQE